MATIEPYQTSSGATLYAVRYRKPDNKQTGSADSRTKRDAQAFAATVEVSKMRGEYVAPSLGRVTVGELGPAWLDRQRGHMKPSGFRSYESGVAGAMSRHGGRGTPSPTSGSPTCRRGSPSCPAERGPVIVQTAYSVLARILDDAVQDRMLASNPARGVKLPKRPPRRNVYLTAEQLHAARRRVRAVSLAGAAARRRRSAVG